MKFADKEIIKKRIGTVGEKVGGTFSKLGKAINNYMDEAPQRRAREIDRLDQEILLEKKRMQLKKIRGQNEPKWF